jgi:hypothetical protein
MTDELAGLSPETRAKLIRSAEEHAARANRERQAIIAQEVEARINTLIDHEIEAFTNRQGFPPSQKQIMDICSNVRTMVRGHS